MAVYFDPAGVCLDASSAEDIVPDTGGIQLVQCWLCRVFVVLRIAVAAHKVLWRVRKKKSTGVVKVMAEKKVNWSGKNSLHSS